LYVFMRMRHTYALPLPLCLATKSTYITLGSLWSESGRGCGEITTTAKTTAGQDAYIICSPQQYQNKKMYSISIPHPKISFSTYIKVP